MMNEKELANELLKLKHLCGWDFETAEECLEARRQQFMLAAFAWASMHTEEIGAAVEQHKTSRGHFDPYKVAQDLLTKCDEK